MKHLRTFNESSYDTVHPEVKNILDTVTDEGIQMEVDRDTTSGRLSHSVVDRNSNRPNLTEYYYNVMFIRPDGMEARTFYDICKNAYDRFKQADYLAIINQTFYGGHDRDPVKKDCSGWVYTRTSSKDHPDGHCHIEDTYPMYSGDIPYFAIYINSHANIPSQDTNVNENLLGDLKRLSPTRRNNDQKASKLFDDVLKDYKEFEDLRKLKIIDKGGSSINIEELTIGDNYDLTYIFGSYHPTYRDAHYNREIGDRRITIKSFPFTLALKRNYYSRVNFGRVEVEEIITTEDFDDENILLNYNNKHVKHDAYEDKYNISSDIAIKLFKFFIEEFDNKYPELKKAKYKGSMGINTIKAGGKPILKYAEVKNLDNKWVTIAIDKDDNENEIKELVSKMSTEESDNFIEERMAEQNKLFEPHNKKIDALKNKFILDLDKSFKKNGIQLEEEKFAPKGINLSFSPEWESRVVFKYNGDIKDKIEKAIQSVGGYQGKLVNMGGGYSDENIKWYTVIFTPIK